MDNSLQEELIRVLERICGLLDTLERRLNVRTMQYLYERRQAKLEYYRQQTYEEPCCEPNREAEDEIDCL